MDIVNISLLYLMLKKRLFGFPLSISIFLAIYIYICLPGLKKFVPISTELIFYPRLKLRFRTKTDISLPEGQWVFPEIAIWKWPACCILSISCIHLGSKICAHLMTFLLWLLQCWWLQIQLSSKNVTMNPTLSILQLGIRRFQDSSLSIILTNGKGPIIKFL